MSASADELTQILGHLGGQGFVDAVTLVRQHRAQWPRWMDLCLELIGPRPGPNEATLDRLLAGDFALRNVRPEINPRQRMLRVARLTLGLRRKGMPAEVATPERLAEDRLLQQALGEGRPLPQSWAGCASVELPILLVESRVARSGRTREHGVIAQLTLRRVPVPEGCDHSLGFAVAPASFLLQRERSFDDAFKHATAALRRHLLPQAAQGGQMLAWDIWPPAGHALLAIGGGSAGAAIVLAALYLMRDQLRDDDLRRHLQLVEWEHAAVTARIVDARGDRLGEIEGIADKLGAWTREKVAALRPTRVFVASGQPMGRYERLLEECADIASLVRAVARHTGKVSEAQFALLQDLLGRQPPPRPGQIDAHLLAVSAERAPAASLRAVLLQRYAALCKPDIAQPEGLRPHQLQGNFVQLTLSSRRRSRLLDEHGQADRTEPETFDSLEQALASQPAEPGAWLLVGQPGGGKTTLLHHYEVMSAQRALRCISRGEGVQELCVAVDLKAYSASEPSPQAWLNRWVKARFGYLSSIDALLAQVPVVRLLFDGLNEITAASSELRLRAVRRLVNWVAIRRQAQRMLAPIFSVREHMRSTLGDEDFVVLDLHVLQWNERQITEYVHKTGLPGRNALLRQILADEPLKALSSVPINLAYQCALFAERRQVATNRAELFSGIAWRRLRREKARHTLDGAGLLSAGDAEQIDDVDWWNSKSGAGPGYNRRLLELPAEGTLVSGLDLQAQAQVSAIGEQARSPAASEPAAAVSIELSRVATWLKPQRKRDAWLQAVQDLGLAEKDPGLTGRFSFAHQLWLEFFAARAFALRAGPDAPLPRGLAPALEPPLREALTRAAAAYEALPLLEKSKWEEVLKMAVQLAPAPAALVERLIGEDPTLAGRAAVTRLQSLPDGGVLRQLRLALLRRSTDASLDLRLRVEAGLALGELGDRIRYEERNGCLIPNAGHWVAIEGGDTTIGSDDNDDEADDDEKPLTEVTVRPFRMAFAPVTNAEYRRFIDAGGYTRAEFWGPDDSDSMKWFRETDRRQPDYWDDGDYNNPLQPVVGVCLWEAMAYCEWLTRQLGDGYRFRLPTEAEWEFAARGKQRHPYPWGDDEPTFDHCNHGATHLERTSPVGVFPKGDRQVGGRGLTDLAGNVNEWTNSRFTDQLEHEALMTVTTHAEGNDVRRALRGGWDYTARGLRAAYRSNFDPDLGDFGIGFRVVGVPI